MIALRAGTIKRVHVNRQLLRRGGAPCTVQTSQGPVPAYRVEILGASRLVYGRKPLSCGAKVWVETRAAVRVFTSARARV